MSEEIKDNGKLTDEQMLKISEIEINDLDKYTGDDRRRWSALQETARAERFKKDPDSFVEVRDMVCCIIHSDRSSLGIACLIPQGVSRSKLNNGIAELGHMVEKMRLQMDIEAEMRRATLVGGVKQPNNYLNKVRGMFHRGG